MIEKSPKFSVINSSILIPSFSIIIYSKSYSTNKLFFYKLKYRIDPYPSSLIESINFSLLDL